MIGSVGSNFQGRVVRARGKPATRGTNRASPVGQRPGAFFGPLPGETPLVAPPRVRGSSPETHRRLGESAAETHGRPFRSEHRHGTKDPRTDLGVWRRRDSIDHRCEPELASGSYVRRVHLERRSGRGRLGARTQPAGQCRKRETLDTRCSHSLTRWHGFGCLRAVPRWELIPSSLHPGEGRTRDAQHPGCLARRAPAGCPNRATIHG